MSVVLGSVNLLALLTTAFLGGRWAGRIETRIDHLEKERS